jgi:hypothetical protein
MEIFEQPFNSGPYINVTNLLVKIHNENYKKNNNTLLINAHFDSRILSPGAGVIHYLL